MTNRTWVQIVCQKIYYFRVESLARRFSDCRQ